MSLHHFKAEGLQCCGRVIDGLIMLFYSVLRRSSSLADINFAAFAENPVNHAVLLLDEQRLLVVVALAVTEPKESSQNKLQGASL